MGARDVDHTVDAIDTRRLVDTCAALVDVAAPTGFEGDCADVASRLLRRHGVDAHLLAHDDRQGSAWGVIPGGSGPTLLLYSPLDTVTTGGVDQDVPQAADVIDGHLLPRSEISADGCIVRGLGAHNPKGHAACIIEAAGVLAKLRPPGTVVVGLGAGGMPTEPLDGDDRAQTGHGVGARALLAEFAERGLRPDAAVVAKSGWFVQHEEVGLAWIDVSVTGTHTYVGARHRLPYRNAIADLAHIALAVEADAARTRRVAGTLEPQTMVASIAAGWPRTAAFLPHRGALRIDSRLLPGESGEDARRRIEVVLDRVRTEVPGLDARTTVVREIHGSRTEPDHWIVASAIAAWEAVAGRRHTPPSGQSGSTDANIIRNAGIPTARIGLPKVHVDGAELGFAEGMNTVDAHAMRELTDVLVRTALGAPRGAA